MYMYSVCVVHQTRRDLLRSVLMLCAGVFAVLGSASLHVPGAGALGCLTAAFVAALSWRRQHHAESREQGKDVDDLSNQVSGRRARMLTT